MIASPREVAGGEVSAEVLAERAACCAPFERAAARLEQVETLDEARHEARRLREALHAIALGLHRVEAQP